MADEKRPTEKTVDEKANENQQKVDNAQVVDSTAKPVEQEKKRTSPTPSNAPVPDESKRSETVEQQNAQAYEEGLKQQEQQGLENRESSQSFVNANNQIIDAYGTFPSPDEDVIVQGSANGNREFRRAQEESKRQQALQEFQTQQREEEEAENAKSQRRKRK